MNQQKYAAWYLLILVVLGLIIYAPAVRNEFVYDDIPYIRDNYQIRSFKYLPRILFSSYPPESRTQGLYRPVLTLSYLVDYHIWGGANHRGFHLTNVVLYLLTLAAFWLVALKLFKNNTLLALLAGLLFAAHPVHAESVNWAVGRCALLSTLFVLLSFYLYILWRERRSAQPSKAFLPELIGSLACYALALGSYEIVIVYPLLLIGYKLLLAPGTEHGKASWRTGKAYYLPLIALVIVYLIVRTAVLGGLGPHGSHQIFEDMTALQRLGYVPALYILNLKILLFPFQLTSIYNLSAVETLFPGSTTFTLLLSGVLFVVIIGGTVFLIAKRFRGTGYGLFWILVTLLPVSNIIPIGMIASERALFLPSVGFCVLVVAVAGRIMNLDRKVFKAERNIYVLAFLAGVFIFYTARAIDRTGDWENPSTFWQTELEMHPLSASAYNSLGWYYYNMGNRASAKRQFRNALEKDKSHKWAHYNLAKLLIEEGNFSEAQQVLMKAAQLGAGARASNYATIGTLYAEMNNEASARTFFEKALEANPNNAAALFEMGNYALQENKPLQAMNLLTRSLEHSTHSLRAGIYNSLGIAHSAFGNPEEAIKDFHNAIDINPRLEKPYLRLAEIYIKLDEMDSAEKILRKGVERVKPPSPDIFLILIRTLTAQEKYDRALEIADTWHAVIPRNPGVHLVRAQLFLAQRDANSALRALRHALKTNPEFTPAYVLLGDICYKARRPDKAREFWEKALSLNPDSAELKKKLALLDRPGEEEKEPLLPGDIPTTAPLSPPLMTE